MLKLAKHTIPYQCFEVRPFHSIAAVVGKPRRQSIADQPRSGLYV